MYIIFKHYFTRYRKKSVYDLRSLKGERMSKKNLVLNESKYDEGDLCEI